MAQMTIVADDLTGAADSAAPFALAGYATYVALDQQRLPQADVLALSTGSRHLPAERAYDVVRQAVSGLPERKWLYKKIDSTLRGQPAAELAALMAAGERTRALVAPAFPAQQRTTVAGRQLVGGHPLEQTPFARQVFSSDLLEHFPTARLIDLEAVWEGVPAVVARLEEEEAGIWVADAETDDDLQTLARAAIAGRIDVACGSGGLARALSALKSFPSASCPVDVGHARGPVLVVAGSRHPASTAQVETLRLDGAAVISPRSALEPAVAALRAGHTVVLACHDDGRRANSKGYARDLAMAVMRVASATSIGGLVVTGGDTANVVCKALGAQGIWLRAELEPGIPLGVLAGARASGLAIATKAGGFGDAAALRRMVSALTGEAAGV
ncbi:MAG TPA: four-carbon acid sugar kinase family protein [Thermomicrobiaceae bacterium]|nr:four-carbon acid sugar kinase family protein [Thermomicrobiaceae bacterium]